MAIRKYAYATVATPSISAVEWDRKAAPLRPKRTAAVKPNLVDQASEILGKTFNPEDYLLTHSTIVCSVDTFAPADAKPGKSLDNGFWVNRKVADFRITPETQKFINGNKDAWERKALLQSYKTFIGGHNFCFTGDTPVVMGDGTTKPIQDIRIGDMVLTHTGTVQAVTHTFERDFEGDICTIYVNKGKTPIRVTGNHPVRSLSVDLPEIPLRGGSQKSRDQYVADLRTKAIRDESRGSLATKVAEVWTPADSLGEGSFLLGPETQWSMSGGVTEDHAVVLGYYLAEGCQLVKVSDPADSKGAVITPGIHERAVVDDLCARVMRIFPDTRCVVTESQTSTYRVELRGKAIGGWLLALGGQYSEAKRISPEVFNWPEQALRFLVASWLNGDGDYHTRTQRLRGATTSKHLAHQFYRIANMLGWKTSLVRTKCATKERQMRIGLKDYSLTPKHDLWSLVFSRDAFNLVAPYTLRWASMRLAAGQKRADVSWWKSCRVYRVTSTGRLQHTGLVYNLEVAGDNSYVVAPGIAVHNCEHIQQEDLSKGRIIDAVARDIGSSVYIDILVATDRKHTDLIRQIESGEMSTLSMGCNCVYTICTKCGNCAADETELCGHIQHQKGNTFYDEAGQKHVIAELCGSSTEAGGGVTFIEASWVAVPAFKGAVVRGILNPEEVDEAVLKKAAKTLASPPKKWVGGGKNKKAGLWDADEGEGDAPAEEVQPKAPEKPKSPLDETTEELTSYMLEEAKKKVKEMMNSERAKAPAVGTAPNDSLVRQASRVYGGAVTLFAKQATSSADFMDKLAGLNAEIGIEIPVSFYRAVLKVGAAPEGAETDEQSVKAYLQKVQDALQVRSLNREEAATVLRLSKMLKKATIRLNG